MNKIVKHSSLLILFLLFAFNAKSQVGIGTSIPDASAQLEILSSSKGLLIPRLSLAQRNDINNPANGLLIYQIVNSPGFYYYNNGQWQKLVNSTEITTGGTGTAANTILSGNTLPTSAIGANGDFYLNTTSTTLYGPKSSGSWPANGTALVGPQGESGSSLPVTAKSLTSDGTITIENGAGSVLKDVTLSLADNAVTSAKIADGAIRNVDLNKLNIPLSGFGLPVQDVSLGGYLLTNLAAPVSDQDAATKKYVDSKLTGTGNSGQLPILSFDGAYNLSILGSNSVSLSDLNQSLSLAGTVLSISGPRNSHIDLASLVGSGGSGSGVVIHDASLTGIGTVSSQLGLSATGVIPGVYTSANLTVDGQGRIIAAANGTSGTGGGLTAVKHDETLIGDGNATNLSLAKASSTTLGGIKVGSNLSIDANGVLSAQASGGVGDITGVIAGTGLTGGALAGDATLGFATIPGKTILGNNDAADAVPVPLNALQIKTLLALENVKNVDQTNADNLVSGTIATGRFGVSTIPIASLKTTGTPAAASILHGDGTWGPMSASSLSGILPVANGGTGLGTYTAGNFLKAGNATTLIEITPAALKTELGIDGKEDAANKSTDITLSDNTDTKFPTEKATKTYVDKRVTDAVAAAEIGAGAVPDATNLLKGKLMLTNDLGGSAASPTVVSVGGATAANIKKAVDLANAATTLNTPGTIVQRDASGNFTANIIKADLNGNATTATTAGSVSGIVAIVNGGTGANNAADARSNLGLGMVENTADKDKKVSDLTQLALNDKINTSAKGQPLGVTPLNASGKIDNAYLPASLVGAVNYQGTYNATSNSPALPVATANKGYYYVVTTAGTQQGLTLGTGDWVISNGTTWDKVSSSSTVSTVFGRTGNILAAPGDYTTAQVTESTNLYYTDARVSTNATVVAKENSANKSTDGTLATNSNTLFPTEKATKTYVDSKVPVVTAADANKVLTVNGTGTATLWSVPTGGSGGGSVSSISATGNNGIGVAVTNASTTPAITLSLANITPTSVSASGNITSGGTVSGTNLTGTNTGDQINVTGNAATVTTNANLTGDVTSVGNATTIGANKVTYAKMQGVTANRLLGSGASGTAVSEITLGTGLSFTGNTLNVAGGGGSGTVTTASVITANGISGTVANATTTPAITLSLGAITPTSVAASGAVTGNNLTGSNTGDQTIALTGDVTGGGTGSFAASIGIGKVTTSHILDATITAADLANQTITATKLSNISTNGTSGQVLSSNGTGGFTWATAATGGGTAVATNLGYTTSATQGSVTSSSGSAAIIPGASSTIAGVMSATDKAKLDKIADISTTDAAKVLTVNAAGTAATWVTPATGSGGGSVQIYHPSDLAAMSVKATGPGITVTMKSGLKSDGTPSGILNLFEVLVPSGVMLQSLQVIGDNATLGESSATASPVMNINIIYGDKSLNTSNPLTWLLPVSAVLYDRITSPGNFRLAALGTSAAILIPDITDSTIKSTISVFYKKWVFTMGF